MKAISQKSGKCICLAAYFIGCYPAFAQQGGTNFSSWLTQGIKYELSDKLAVQAQTAWNPQQDIYFLYGQGSIKLNKYATLTAGYMGIGFSKVQGHNKYQSTLLHGIILAIPVHKVTIENRSLVWNRLITNGEDHHLYRNRLRLISTSSALHRPLRLFILDEITFNITNGKWQQNRVGPGATIIPSEWLDLELAFIRQNDSSSGKSNLIFVTLTCRLPHTPK
ncbi:DUF2490 domain-containing protein [Dyadobacter sp. LJ53]|uniref:DUF2490 domain-containing protein n=1 Tax=Dyadobacter chenwenxiniae TaxID=2906456 RepID=UPI001F3DCE6A|nr:DUF2490 domain-containing protein [Dyadobacter chenwenxiniae]MCF0051694.1 DUF2490 domain-containing protein [Dyadobacter chenwenxiniae]